MISGFPPRLLPRRRRRLLRPGPSSRLLSSVAAVEIRVHLGLGVLGSALSFAVLRLAPILRGPFCESRRTRWHTIWRGSCPWRVQLQRFVGTFLCLSAGASLRSVPAWPSEC